MRNLSRNLTLSDFFLLHPRHSRPRRLLHGPSRQDQGHRRRGRAHRVGPPPLQARGEQVRPPHGPPPQEVLRELPGPQEEEDRPGPVPQEDGEDAGQAHEAAAHLSEGAEFLGRETRTGVSVTRPIVRLEA